MKKWRAEYNKKYDKIPKDQHERIQWMYDFLNINDKKMNDIEEEKKKIEKRMKTSRKVVKMVFYIVPEGISRPRKGRNGSFYVPNMMKFYECMNEYMMIHREMEELFIYTECSIDCKYYRPMPSDMTKLEKVLAELKYIKSIKKPDWDNLGKSTDMLSKIWLDDSIVTDARVRKYYSFKPRIEIKIMYYTNYLNSYNKKISIKKGR